MLCFLPRMKAVERLCSPGRRSEATRPDEAMAPRAHRLCVSAASLARLAFVSGGSLKPARLTPAVSGGPHTTDHPRLEKSLSFGRSQFGDLILFRRMRRLAV